MLLVEDYNYLVNPQRMVVVILNVLLSAGSITIGLLSLSKAAKSDIARKYFLGIALFFIALGVGRAFYVIDDYFTPGYTKYELTPANIYYRLATFSTLLGFTALEYLIESTFIKKTRYTFTIFGIVCTTSQLSFPFIIADSINFYAIPALTIIPFLLYLYLAITLKGSIKIQALIVIVGMVLLITGFMILGLLYKIGLLERIWTSIFGPPVSLAGLIVVGYGLIYKKGEF
nr:hypothetical protein [Candidatus Sigynarchaeum springense]